MTHTASKPDKEIVTKQIYVAGLMFDNAMQRVVLIRKGRPAWQRGMLNGIGGKIEDGEGNIAAMIREFAEEAGVQTEKSDWKYFMQMRGDHFSVDFFYGRSTEHFEAARTMETEELVKVDLDQLHKQAASLVPGLNWAIPMAVHAEAISGVSFAQVFFK